MSFKIGDEVKPKVTAPVGEVQDARMNTSGGELEYLVTYADADGEAQERWFLESQIEAV